VTDRYVLPAADGYTLDLVGLSDVTDQQPVNHGPAAHGLYAIEFAAPLTDSEADALLALVSTTDSWDAQQLAALRMAEDVLSEYLDLADPTAAQTRAQVTVLTRVIRRLVRLRLRETR
jgi:hypothetical protein